VTVTEPEHATARDDDEVLDLEPGDNRVNAALAAWERVSVYLGDEEPPFLPGSFSAGGND
jgi:hypothetical protein